ncbi:class I SAM-dependent methyltransferase [Bradyrhizobium prioriisuperbiae]|uniref:class I SAM-dependent methyltransferase n=1 Tax=Bradyrhizobium prioriisuperbiae TaxID=2854389 RepID=UPI0028E4EAA9|nr:class I SAM-dependent methyltransferase [Bradyrhizobium prioritasuperba]
MNVARTAAREMVRHLIYKTGSYDIITRFRAWRGRASEHLNGADLKSRFEAIYDTGVWQQGWHEATPGSGAGSSVAATVALREALPSLLNDLNAKTLLDVGCGDFSWMQHVSIGQRYIGIDVVGSVIETNARLYGQPGREFRNGDATVDELPDADVVLCREVLFHLSFVDIRKLLRNVLSKKRSYLITTSDRLTTFNSDIPTGDFRLLNVEARPLKFPPPDIVIDDSAVFSRRIIGVWDASRLSGILRGR